MAINNMDDLALAITALEQKKTLQQKALKVQFNETVESFQPKNLLKAAYKNAIEEGGIGSTLLKVAGGIGTSVLGGKLLAGGGLVSKIAGTAINAGTLDNILNKDKIMAWGKAIFNNLFKKKKSTIN